MTAKGWLACLGAAGCIALAADLADSVVPSATVSGKVTGAKGPLAGATVRVRATENSTATGPDGSFVLQSLVEGQEVEVTAWAAGYYVAMVRVVPSAAGVRLKLRPYHTSDNPDYEWALPETCNECHPMIVEQWVANAHGGAISNARFFSMYNGTDLEGTKPVSPGYLQDFPGTAGNCAGCHAPGAAVDGYLSTNMNEVRGSPVAGIHCDYCHKIAAAYIDPATGSVYHNAPGTESLRVLRPPPGDDIFFGPYDDIKDPDTYVPIMAQSQYCAPCHNFSFWGTPIYQSYNEWLASSYARAGITCQACHMPPNGDTHFALPEKGGLYHPPEKIPSHQDLGLASERLMRNTVRLSLSGTRKENGIDVTVRIVNKGAGHHVPTDFPGRNMILILTAKDGDGNDLRPSGVTPLVPQWGGDLAGRPGKGFAKVLQDVATGQFPVVSYWKQTRIISDNRIPANGKDISRYHFEAPAGDTPVTITAELRFRRAFQDLITAKGWNSPDILMEQRRIVLNPPEIPSNHEGHEAHEGKGSWELFFVPLRELRGWTLACQANHVSISGGEGNEISVGCGTWIHWTAGFRSDRQAGRRP